MEKRKHTDRLYALCVLPMAAWTALFVGGALLYIIVLSFMTRSPDGIGSLAIFTWENYTRILDPSYARVLLDSLLLALESTLICFAVGYPFGYMLARMRGRKRAAVLMLVMVPFWTNALVRVYGWEILLLGEGPINSFLKSLGIIEKSLKLLNTRGAVLMGMTYALLPFMILPVYSAVDKMDWSLAEAARDLGSSPARVFLNITFPLTCQGALSGILLVFVPSISLIFISDMLGGGNYMLAGNLIYNQLYKSRDWPFAAAMSVVLLVLISALLVLYRRAGKKYGNTGLI